MTHQIQKPKIHLSLGFCEAKRVCLFFNDSANHNTLKISIENDSIKGRYILMSHQIQKLKIYLSPEKKFVFFLTIRPMR